jgi:hypothetical protein
MTQLSTRPEYRTLSFVDKRAQWGRGCMYEVRSGVWRCEWSSGKRRASGRVIYNIVCLHGSYAAARQLLDLIVSKPHRIKEDAMALIAPYVQTTKLNGTNPIREIVDTDIPPSPADHHVARRKRIQLDYWRVRLLDTIEAYRRFDDA